MNLFLLGSSIFDSFLNLWILLISSLIIGCNSSGNNGRNDGGDGGGGGGDDDRIGNNVKSPSASQTNSTNEVKKLTPFNYRIQSIAISTIFSIFWFTLVYSIIESNFNFLLFNQDCKFSFDKLWYWSIKNLFVYPNKVFHHRKNGMEWY